MGFIIGSGTMTAELIYIMKIWEKIMPQFLKPFERTASLKK
jgi:hypothetical protein